MPVDELDRVRRANPVPEPPAAPPLEPLRRRLDAEAGRPRTLRPRRRRIAVRLVIVITAVAALATALLASPSGQPDVLAAVYRVTTPGTGTLHMQWQTRRYENGKLTSSSRVTVWDQPRLKRSRTLTHNVDHNTGRVTDAELATVWSRSRWWSSRRPGIIREFRERTGRLAAWDGGIGFMRLLYRNGRLKLVSRTSDDRWELRGESNGKRLVAYVNGKSLVPIEIRQQSAPPGTSLTITRYSIFRHERSGPRLGLDMPTHRGLPVVPLPAAR
jgi:hypothetical protein